VKQQSFLIGEGRALRDAAVSAAFFGRHFECPPENELKQSRKQSPAEH
jgi:hypothetical protein